MVISLKKTKNWVKPGFKIKTIYIYAKVAELVCIYVMYIAMCFTER